MVYNNVENAKNTAGIIGTEGQNSTIKIKNYEGRNIENSEDMSTVNTVVEM